jgi:hypothetical protein
MYGLNTYDSFGNDGLSTEYPLSSVKYTGSMYIGSNNGEFSYSYFTLPQPANTPGVVGVGTCAGPVVPDACGYIYPYNHGGWIGRFFGQNMTVDYAFIESQNLALNTSTFGLNTYNSDGILIFTSDCSAFIADTKAQVNLPSVCPYDYYVVATISFPAIPPGTKRYTILDGKVLAGNPILSPSLEYVVTDSYVQVRLRTVLWWHTNVEILWPGTFTIVSGYTYI